MVLMSNQNNYEVDPHFNFARKPRKRPANQLYSESAGKDGGSMEVLQWVCEICEKETFNTFKEACQHEISCVQRSVNEKMKESEKSVKKRKKESDLKRKIATICKPVATKTSNDTPVNDEVGSDLNMKWVCEWCNTAMFNTYAETVAHEKVCLQAHINRNKQQFASKAPKPPSSSKPLKSDIEPTSSPVSTPYLPGPNSRPLMHEQQMVVHDIMSRKPNSINNLTDVKDTDESVKNNDACETNEVNETSETIDGENDVEEVTHWVCEFCRVAMFDSYEKAAEHEATCKFAPQMQEKRPEIQSQKVDEPISDHNSLKEQKFDVESKSITNGSHNVQMDTEKTSEVSETSEANKETKTETVICSKNDDDPNKKDESKTHIVRWVCEVCEIVTFDTYVEACCHEIECRKKKQLLNKKKIPSPDPVCSSNDKAKALSESEENKLNISNEISNDSNKKEIRDETKSQEDIGSNQQMKVPSRPSSNACDVKSDAVTRSSPNPHPTKETAHGIQNNVNRLHQSPQSLSDITKAFENGMNHPLKQMQGFGNPLSNKTNNIINHGIPNHNYATRIPNDINEAINMNVLPGKRSPFLNPMGRVMQVPNFTGNTNPNDVGSIMNHIMQLQNQTNSHPRNPEILLATMHKLNAMPNGLNYDFNALNHLMLNDRNRNINNLQAASHHLSHMSKINGNINTNASTNKGGTLEHQQGNNLLFLQQFGLLDPSKHRATPTHGADGNNGSHVNLLAAGASGLSNSIRSINGNYRNHNQINNFPPLNPYNDNTNVAMLIQRHINAINHGKAIDFPNRIIEIDEGRTVLGQKNLLAKDQRNACTDKSKNKEHDIARITLPPMDKRSLLNPGSNTKELDSATTKLDEKDIEGSKSENGKNEVSKLNTEATDTRNETTETYRWLCESCESQMFSTYQEAVAHEAICREAKKKKDEGMLV